MSTVLRFKNKYLDSSITVAESPDSSDPRAHSVLFNSIETAPIYYYSMNNLIMGLAPDPSSAPVDVAFDPESVSMDGKVFWKSSNLQTDPTRSIENYTAYRVEFSITSKDSTRIELKIKNESIQAIKNDFIARGLTKPDYGILELRINFVGLSVNYVLKYTDLPIYSAVTTPAAPAATIRNYYLTPTYTFESLYIPTLSASFVYNFYESNEEDFEIASRRDYSSINLRDIPKYIKLSWTAAPNLSAGSSTDVRLRTGGVLISPEEIGPSRDTVVRGSSLLPAGFEGSSTESPSVPFLGVLITEPVPLVTALAVTVSQYLGYVISKEKLNKETGDYEIVDFLIVKNRLKTNLIDWKIGYGESYRYKIRSVFQYVNRDGISIYQDSDSLLTRNEQTSLFGTTGLNSYLYYFDSDFSINQDIECVEFVRPQSPTKIQIFPNSQERKIFITWNQKNPNKDVKGFNVYRKDLSKNSYFKKLNQELIDIRHNFFNDSSIEVDEVYIYAIESVDVHENFSTLSIQLSAKITPFDYDLGFNEESPEFFEYAGQELIVDGGASPNLDEYTYFKDKCQISINPVFAEHESGKSFRLKVLSLDTLQTKEIKLKFRLNTIYHRGLDLERDARPETVSFAPEGADLPPDIGRLRRF